MGWSWRGRDRVEKVVLRYGGGVDFGVKWKNDELGRRSGGLRALRDGGESVKVSGRDKNKFLAYA